MHRVFHLFRSLKARITLLTLLIVVTSLMALGAYAKWLLGEGLVNFVGEQQQSALSLLSGQLTQEVQDRQTALTALGGELALGSLQDRAALQAVLKDERFLASQFNGGVLVWDAQGRMQAHVLFAPDLPTAELLEPSTLASVLRDGTNLNTITRAHDALHSDLLTMVVPMRSPQGAVVGALAGVIALDRPNFLLRLTAQTYGRTGNFFVIDPRQRLIFATSDKKRLMEVLPAPGVSPWIDRFMNGFEGSARVVNPHGVEVLVSVQQIPLTGWYATVTLSPEEALSLLQSIAPRGRLAAAALALLCVTLVWLMLRYQLAPMTMAVRTMEGFVGLEQIPPPLQVVRQDEIGQLVGGFNRLLDAMGQQQQVLRQSEMFQQAVLNSVTAEIAVLNHSGVILAVNEAWRRSELPPGPGPSPATGNAGVGSNYLKLCDARTSELPVGEEMSVSDGIRGVLASTLDHFQQEYPCHTEQQQRWGRISVTPLERAVWQGAVVSIENITERVQMQDQVRELAFYDPLTHLPNRRLVLDRLAHHMLRARRAQTRLALLFVDLDKFKPINDALGHAVGDWLLQNVALRIQSCLRESDTPARIGGDEFVVVLPDLYNQDAALAVAEKIRHELAQSFVTPQGNTLHISSSIGVALYPDHAQTEKDLLRLGDEAMYQAKKGGRNAVILSTAKAPEPVAQPSLDPAQSFVHMLWQASFACGQEQIDQQHQTMFALTNDLLDQTAARRTQPQAFEQAFDRLMAHVQVHFAHEEVLLRSLGYDALEQHTALHQSLVARAMALHLALQDSSQDNTAELALVQFLVTDLVTEHMLHADRAYFPWMAKIQA